MVQQFDKMVITYIYYLCVGLGVREGYVCVCECVCVCVGGGGGGGGGLARSVWCLLIPASCLKEPNSYRFYLGRSI